MLRGRDVFRLPIVTRDKGEKVGEVKDLIVDRHGGKVVGVIAEEKGLFSDVRVVPWGQIETVGLDAVIAKDAHSVVKSHEVPEIAEVLDRGYVLHGKRVGTTDGTELGTIENFFFDRQTGAVLGYELSGAVVHGASGQAFLPAHPSFEAGKDYVFVDPVAAEGMEDLREALRSRAEGPRAGERPPTADQPAPPEQSAAAEQPAAAEASAVDESSTAGEDSPLL